MQGDDCLFMFFLMHVEVTMKSRKSGSRAANRRDFFAEVTDKILRALEKGCVPWIRPWTDNPGTREIPMNAHGRQYRGINRVLLGMEQFAAGYTTQQWFTRRMANEAGGHIRKGEKGTPVVLFRPVDRKPSADGDPDPNQNNAKEDSRRYWVYRFYHVWNRDQLEGVDAVPAPAPIARGSTAHRHGLADMLFLSTDAEVRYGGNRAYYAPGPDHIRLPLPEQFSGVDGFHATRLHELVHWTGHASRLARKYGSFGSPDYAREELVAEMGSAFLCDWCGLEAELQHPEYIASWLKVLNDDRSAVIVAASQAQKAFDFLLEQSGMNVEPNPLRDAA